MTSFASTNPARPAEVIGTYETATVADVDRAVATAAERTAGMGEDACSGQRRI